MFFAGAGDEKITNKWKREQKVREILHNNLKVKRRKECNILKKVNKQIRIEKQYANC